MAKLEYEVKKCGVCGAALPVRQGQQSVTCRFCGSEYDVVKVHGQRINGQFGFTEGLLIGGLAGLVLGGIVFTSFGRATAKAAIAKGMAVTEEVVSRALERGEKS